MSQPEIKNETPFKVEPLMLQDENFRPIVTTLVKASYDIVAGRQLRLSAVQAPACLSGEYWGDPESNSLKYEPETAFIKPSTDIVLVGHAYAENGHTTELTASLRVGVLKKEIKILGNRVWEKKLFRYTATEPLLFDKMPLNYEQAFGGKDPRGDTEETFSMDARNSLGKGYCDPSLKPLEGHPLPNIEDPNQLIRHYRDNPYPVGFGFLLPSWKLRQQYAGTYDAAWGESRKPLLPIDFDRRFFNAASPGLISPQYLFGNEPVEILNVSQEGPLMFNLPSIPAPILDMTFRLGDDKIEKTNLDTIIINTDENKVFLIWRACTALDYGHLDLAELIIKNDGVAVLAA